MACRGTPLPLPYGLSKILKLQHNPCPALPCPALPYPTLPFPSLPFPSLPFPSPSTSTCTPHSQTAGIQQQWKSVSCTAAPTDFALGCNASVCVCVCLSVCHTASSQLLSAEHSSSSLSVPATGSITDLPITTLPVPYRSCVSVRPNSCVCRYTSCCYRSTLKACDGLEA